MPPALSELKVKIGILFDSFEATKRCPEAELEWMTECVMSEVENFVERNSKKRKVKR